MIKFDVTNRFTGSVQFTAEIDCGEGENHSSKLGLAVKWAVKNGVSLYGANLYGASLKGANLEEANLEGANLYGANLEGASLEGASLEGANINRASLYGASLYGASLYGANLEGASLEGASLEGANLYGASLKGANLEGANLYGANLEGVSGINDWVKCIQIDQYPIAYTSTVMQIGCERHLISEWAEFDDRRIAEMDGKEALKFWRKYKGLIFQTIDLCPAKPTGAEVAA